MIDRRQFLKGIIGTGFSAGLLSDATVWKRPYDRLSYLCELQCPDVSLIVKVREVITYQATSEIDVCGSCLVAFEPTPIEIRFFITKETEKLLNFEVGMLYLMTGHLYLNEEEPCVNLIHPEFKKIEDVLNAAEIKDVEESFFSNRSPIKEKEA